MARVVMLLFGGYTFRTDPRVERETKTLARHGHRVAVIAWNRDGHMPPYEKREHYELVWLKPRLPRSFEKFAMSAQFLVKLIASCLFSVRSVISALRLRPEVIHAHDLDTLIPATFLKWLTHAKLVFDSHENYPAILSADLGPAGYWLGLAIQKVLLKVPDVVVVSNEAISRKLGAQVDSYVVGNLVDLEWFDAASQTRLNWNFAKPVVIYVGAVGAGIALPNLVEASRIVRSEVEILVAGGGPLLNEVEEMCKKQHLSVKFTGYISRDLLPPLICLAAIGVVLLKPTPNNIESLPNKLFEYMAGGLPVIASDFPLIHEVVSLHRCGITVDPTSPLQIAKAIDYLILHPSEARRLGANGRRLVEQRYSWALTQHTLLKAYAALGYQST